MSLVFRDDNSGDNQDHTQSEQATIPTSTWKIGKYLLCPSSNPTHKTITLFLLSIWLVSYIFLIIMLLVCGVHINFSSAISSCGETKSLLRPMFVATFSITGLLFTILFISRFIVMYTKWFGLETKQSKHWRRFLICGTRIPGRRELTSVAFWLMFSTLIPGIASNILLLLMAILPDEKPTKTVHFVTAFVGLLLLVIYILMSATIHIWRLIRLCRGKTSPFELVRHIENDESKKKVFVLSVTSFSCTILWHMVCFVGACVCIPVYVTKFIPAFEWVGVCFILLGMFPLAFDNMLSVKEGEFNIEPQEDSSLLR